MKREPKYIVILKNLKSTISGIPQRLQPKILIFTFGASLLPVVLVFGIAWRFVYQPLTDLEKTRLDDQVLAFRGFTSATGKGLQDLANGYAIWTALYNAVQKRDRAWMKEEVTDQLVFSTDVDNVQVVNRFGETLAERGIAWRSMAVQERVVGAIAKKKPLQELVTYDDRQMLILVAAPIFQSDGKGNSPGTLIVGQTLNDAWLRKFLNFSQPTTKLAIISLDGQLMLSSIEKMSRDTWEENNLTAKVLPAIKLGESVYHMEPESGHNTIYAPIKSGGKPVAIAKIQISSQYFQQASLILNRVIWIGLAMAIVLSIAIARLLARQIGEPIKQLALRSKTLATGDLDSPIPGIDSGGEIGQLANAYQEMAKALKRLICNLEQRVAERTQELELARQTLEERVKERTEELWQKNQQLQSAHDQLQQLNLEISTKAEQLSQALKNLKKAQVQLVQTEKMSSLGQLVAGIAHEINNPINFIYANLSYVNRYTQNLLDLVDIYQENYSSNEIEQVIEQIELDFLRIDLPKIISSMQSGADRISKIVLSLRNFSRLDEAEMKLVNIHEGLDSTLLILQSRLKMNKGYTDIELIQKYGNLPLVECYPRQINQVFMNIISNAIDELEKQKEQQNKQITIETGVQTENEIRITIRDNGSGISREVKHKIFDPFFTTKPVGKGTGLGLSIAYQIIEKHGGYIDVISEPGCGAEFAIVLPIKQF